MYRRDFVYETNRSGMFGRVTEHTRSHPIGLSYASAVGRVGNTAKYQLRSQAVQDSVVGFVCVE